LTVHVLDVILHQNAKLNTNSY